MKTGIFSDINEDLARQKKAVVIKIITSGRTAPKALEIVANAFVWTDHLIERTESEPELPRPIVCQSGCHYCCFNQVELSPLEALSIGDCINRTFTAAEKAALLIEVDRAIRFKAGKSKREIARPGKELRCPLLRGDRCSVYEVRPLMCRAIHSLEASQCERAFRSGRHTGVEHYSHRNVIVGSILKGLLEGCREMDCQAEPLDLASSLKDFFAAPNPLEQWIKGERIFSPLRYPEK